MRWLGGLLLICSLVAGAEERISVCYNYGCHAEADVVYSDEQLRVIGFLLSEVRDAAQEREAISLAVGRMLGWAGKQSAIFADRGGNYADDAVYGKMDCIDHSTTTTRLLRLMESQGWLRYHRVLEPEMRARLFVLVHYSAVIEEKSAEAEGGAPGRYVVDSWFYDNGLPAVVLPLAEWNAGGGPYVGN